MFLGHVPLRVGTELKILLIKGRVQIIALLRFQSLTCSYAVKEYW